jgi:hypothetical protein
MLVEPVLKASAGQRCPLGEAEQARAGAGDLRFRGGERGRRVAHLDGETVSGGAVEAQLDRGRGLGRWNWWPSSHGTPAPAHAR